MLWATLLRLSCCVLGLQPGNPPASSLIVLARRSFHLRSSMTYLTLSTALSDTMNRSSLSVSQCATWSSRWSRFTNANWSVRLLRISELRHWVNSHCRGPPWRRSYTLWSGGCPIIAFFNGQFLCRGLTHPSYPSFVDRRINSTSSHCRMISDHHSSVVLNAGSLLFCWWTCITVR